MVQLAASLDPEDLDRSRLAAERHRRQILVFRVVLDRLTDRFAHQDLSRTGSGTEPAGDVDRVADDGVLEPAVAPDVAGEYLAVVDPDADTDLGPARRRPSCCVEPRERLAACRSRRGAPGRDRPRGRSARPRAP